MSLITETGKYLLFSTQQKAVEANLVCYENLARSKPKVIRSLTEEEINPSTVPTGELVAMVYTIPGYTEESIEVTEGQTKSWSIIHQCLNIAGYVIPKPIDSLMTNVVYDSIVDYDENWYIAPEVM